MYVRENAYKKGEANLTAQSFCKWVNDDLLPSHNLPPELPRFISVHTATRWLSRLGFSPTSHKKGAYVDGHKRADVASRGEFLSKLKELKDSHLPPPTYSDEQVAIPPPDAESRKLVLIYHDESIFNTNEGQQWMWASEDNSLHQTSNNYFLLVSSSKMTIMTLRDYRLYRKSPTNTHLLHLPHLQ